MEKQYFKVGDLVTCPIFGKGRVSVIYGNNSPFPIGVSYKTTFEVYTFDGRFRIDGNRVLHRGHINIPEPELKEIEK